MIKDKIIEYCNSLGLDTIGFIPCRNFEELVEFYKYRKENNLENEFEEKEIEKRINPRIYMKDGKTIISIAFPYYHEDSCEKHNGFSIYTKRGDYHRVVKGYLDKICNYLNSLGWEAVSFVDSNYLPERYIAYLAGVGFIGRNNMIITEKYGSYVFLGEIITNAPIECNEVRSFQDISKFYECNQCDICIRECPTKSINKSRVNPNICLSYITQKKDINDKEIKLLKGNVFGCDFCQLKCPYNQSVKINVLEEFKTLEYMNDETYIYANMDNKIFKEKIAKTSCGWRGKNVIRRNAIIKMHNENYDIEEFKGESPYINNYIEMLKEKKK